jgi:hypothetical protein
MSWVRNTPEGTPTEGPKITGIISTFLSVGFVLLCLRLYVRTLLIKAVGYGEPPAIRINLALCILTLFAR